MKFIIRDDDPCALTSVDELAKCYQSILGDIPVCLSLTPFRMPGLHPGYDGEDRNKPHALEENQELVEYLSEGYRKKWYSYAMHGYHHVYSRKQAQSDRIEYPDYDDRSRPWVREYLYGDDLQRKTRHGKAYLENLLKIKISTFVPPGNAISREGLSAIIENNLNLVGFPKTGLLSNRNRPANPYNHFNALKRKFWKLRSLGKYKYPYVLDFKTHKEVNNSLLYPKTDLQELLAELDYFYRANGIFVLSTHYHAFGKKIASGETIGYALMKVIERAIRYKDVEFVTYDDIW